MKTLDRYIVRTFLTSVLMWFIVVMSLRILVDLITNLDEFSEDHTSAWSVFWVVMQYYMLHSIVYVQELGKVVLVLAAVTTLYMMNRTNELTAILAAGISLHRVIVPIVIASVLLSGVLILNQEMLIPTYAQVLSGDPDEWGKERNEAMRVYLPPDGSNTTWYSPSFDAKSGIMSEPALMMREKGSDSSWPDYKGTAIATGRAAKPGALTLLNAPKAAQRAQEASAPTPVRTPRGTLEGWFIHDGFFVVRNDREAWNYTVSTQRVVCAVTEMTFLTAAAEVSGTDIHPKDPVLFDSRDRTLSLPEHRDAKLNLTLRTWKLTAGPAGDGGVRNSVLHGPQFIFQSPVDGRVMTVVTANTATWMPPGTEVTVQEKGKSGGKAQVKKSQTGFWQLTGGTLFCPSDLTAKKLVIQQSTRWLDYLSTRQLGNLLDDSGRANITKRVAMTRHTHLADPINNLILLLLVVPFILSRERNIKASTGLGILMGLSFYAFVYICRYTGLSPMLAAWLPVWLFAPVAAVMVDSVKT